MFQDREYLESLQVMVLPLAEFKHGTYIAIQVTGSSMEHAIKHMDYVICSQVAELQRIKRGRVYVLVTEDGIICKRAKANYEGDGKVWLGSDNPAYGDEKVKPQEILQTWEVRAILTSNTVAVQPVPPAGQKVSTDPEKEELKAN